MAPKHKRMAFLAIAMLICGIAVGITLYGFRDNLVFFYTPTQLNSSKYEQDKRLRLGGLVKEGSVVFDKPSQKLRFIITDMENSVSVSYQGIIPTLFREGQGVVAEGTLASDGNFQAVTLLAKHDENYMPPQVSEQFKKSGQWQHYKDKMKEQFSEDSPDSGSAE